MINNINNDINRFDGKYLKCVVSKYPSVLKFLANSGSMIVLQPQNELINQDIVETISNGKYKINIKNSESKQRNYIYLGDEFLASGYGFTTIQYRNTGERIIKTYDATIDRLDEADATEKETREKKDKEIMEEFKKYVAINGGPIENTVVNFDGDGTKRIRTRDIILYGEEAQYIDLSVENIIITLYDHNGYAYKAENNQCIFPFGGIVTSIAIEIIGKDNDSGGDWLNLAAPTQAQVYANIAGIMNSDNFFISQKNSLVNNLKEMGTELKESFGDLAGSLGDSMADNVKAVATTASGIVGAGAATASNIATQFIKGLYKRIDLGLKKSMKENGTSIILRIGRYQLPPCFPSSVSWNFDFTQVDEYGFPRGGTITFEGLQSPKCGERTDIGLLS